jgi:hypothetical protein
MTFTGTLIEDLMTTVERAERKTQSHEVQFAERADGAFQAAPLAETSGDEISPLETWFVSVAENTDYDSQFIGVA